MTLPPSIRRQYASVDDVDLALTALEEMPIDGIGVALQVVNILTALGAWLTTRQEHEPNNEQQRLASLGARVASFSYRLGTRFGTVLKLPQPTYSCVAGPSAQCGHDSLGELRYYVTRDGTTRALTHYVRHVGCGAPPARRAHPNAPGCFSHGYAGSGPADLARAILNDYLALGAHQPHPSLYQAFKRDHLVALRQGAGWRLDGVTIWEWLWRPDVATLPWLEPPPMSDGLSAQQRACEIERGTRWAFGVPVPADDQWGWLELTRETDTADLGAQP